MDVPSLTAVVLLTGRRTHRVAGPYQPRRRRLCCRASVPQGFNLDVYHSSYQLKRASDSIALHRRCLGALAEAWFRGGGRLSRRSLFPLSCRGYKNRCSDYSESSVRLSSAWRPEVELLA